MKSQTTMSSSIANFSSPPLSLDASYNNNKQSLSPKFLGWLWILDRLFRVGYVYSFPPLYSI